MALIFISKVFKEVFIQLGTSAYSFIQFFIHEWSTVSSNISFKGHVFLKFQERYLLKKHDFGRRCLLLFRNQISLDLQEKYFYQKNYNISNICL